MKNVFGLSQGLIDAVIAVNEATKIPGMTLAQHAEIKRRMKSEISKADEERTAAINKHGELVRRLEEHEKLHPSYAEKQKKKNASYGDYREPGRDAERTPSGGMGAK